MQKAAGHAQGIVHPRRVRAGWLMSPRWSMTEMDLPMAGTAKSDEIFFHVVSQSAARLDMMNLEIFGTSASLASPAIAFEHPLTKHAIGIPVQSKPGLSRDR